MLNKAQEAKQANEKAEEDDLRRLTAIEAATHLTNEDYYDINGDKAVIPAGFAVSQVEGENVIDDGLVIIDKNGNEFVWVPCTTTGEEGLISYAQDKQYNDGSRGTSETKEYYYKDYSDWTDETGEANKASVEKYGGFYVARYEAGVPSDVPFYANEDGATYYTDDTNPSKDVNTYIPVSKANNQSWNYISQRNAVKVSENMYAGSSSVKSQLIDSYAWDTIMNWMESEKSGIALDSSNYGNYSNNTSITTNALYALHRYGAVTSTGTENGKVNYWTAATTYKKGNITSGTISLSEAIRDQYEFTNYDDTNYTYAVRKEMATGASDVTKVKNIYDMAGNMLEWTTEVGYHNAEIESTQYSVLRGGSFGDSGREFPVSNRHGNNSVFATSMVIGFRVVLYL